MVSSRPNGGMDGSVVDLEPHMKARMDGIKKIMDLLWADEEGRGETKH